MFVAVVPPPEVVEHLDDFLAVRREAAGFRWSVPDQWHLTVAFSPQVPERSLDDLDERLGRAAGRRRPFTLRIAGGGAFPHPDRARVLYARLEADEVASTELDRLASGCRAAFSRAGATADGQRFRPHLTLARLGRPDNVTSWIRLLDAYGGPAWQVNEIALVASHLGEGPRGRPGTRSWARTRSPERSLTFVARRCAASEDRRVSIEIGTDDDPQHFHDDMGDHVGTRLNWLRAGVLGANDGIVSTAGVVMGVAGATDDSGDDPHRRHRGPDRGRAEHGHRRVRLGQHPARLREGPARPRGARARAHARDRGAELAKMYVDKGLSPETAERVARELTEHDALRAHADIEFGIDPDNLTNPWHAAWASMIAFTVGALLPLLVVALVPDGVRILVTVLSVVAALALTGFVSARIGYSPRLPAVVRNVAGGLLAMGVTYLIGSFAGIHIG